MSIFKQPLIQNPPPNLQGRDKKSSSNADVVDTNWDDDDNNSDGADADGGD